MANKVKFGLSNVHYAVITYDANGDPTWATPVAVNGAVSLSLSKESSDTTFYADNSKYFMVSVNNGYTGTLEMALFPTSMRQAIWGQILNSADKMLIENVNDTRKEFALMFEVEGNDSPRRYCYPRCVASRPDDNASTTNESTEPQTQSCDITVLPVVYEHTPSSILNGAVKYGTTEDTATAKYTAFFNAVGVATT